MKRLFRPQSIAVIGGGAWCESVVLRCRDMGFQGPIWPVHPKKTVLGGMPAFARIEDLPGAPDAVFIGINRHATVEAIGILSKMAAGGAVCFASGFSEAKKELSDGVDLQKKLLMAAGDMPILGPNCYGFINYLDGALLWPDQHGGARVDRGVAILTQSSNIAINLTMQTRGLPLAYVVTAGNQAQTGLAEIGEALLQDARVTALGLHIEGIGDLRAFEALAATARDLGKRIVALKAGRSEQARAATISHTASLAGSDAGACALLNRLGIAQVPSLTAMLETLKILHVAGPLRSNRIASMSCSGGEASLMADAVDGRGVVFSPLNAAQKTDLRAALGPKVALANPLDYHTYIWGDRAALTATFSAMMDPDLALGCIVLDFPRPDRCVSPDWDLVIQAAKAAQGARGVPLAIVSSLPETLPEEVCCILVDEGIVPLCGFSDAITSIETAAKILPEMATPVLLPIEPQHPTQLTEAQAKSVLADFGVQVPNSFGGLLYDALANAATEFGCPLVLKGEGLAHKSAFGAVTLNLTSLDQVMDAANQMPCDQFLLEEMIPPGGVEMLVGVVLDAAHGYVLTLAAGGILTEILDDAVSLILPVTADQIIAALEQLRIAALLTGYRNSSPVSLQAVVNCVLAVQEYVVAHHGRVAEVEINPLICLPDSAIAADALIRVEE